MRVSLNSDNGMLICTIALSMIYIYMIYIYIMYTSHLRHAGARVGPRVATTWP